jgi:hypothetical protein
VPSKLAELIRRARRLASERDRLIDELAAEWTAALRGQGLSPTDLDELWAGLTEEAVRRLGRAGNALPAQALGIEAAEVIGKVREKVEGGLGGR